LHLIGGLMVLLVIGVVYFLPTIIAVNRHRVSVAAIAVVNLLFGWTLLGWVIALVWSLTGNPNSAIGASPAAIGGERKCPHCAEMIKWEANVCRFCGRDVPPATTENQFVRRGSYYDPNARG
jgi:hypothetical protein